MCLKCKSFTEVATKERAAILMKFANICHQAEVSKITDLATVKAHPGWKVHHLEPTDP